jgi:hypothetical protein
MHCFSTTSYEDNKCTNKFNDLTAGSNNFTRFILVTVKYSDTETGHSGYFHVMTETSKIENDSGVVI